MSSGGLHLHTGTSATVTDTDIRAPGQTIPDGTIAKLSPRGTICIYTLRTTHVLLDATGHVE